MQYKIIVDKQPSSNPSDEKKEYIIDIEELRVKGDVYDSLVITKDEDYVMRRLSLSEYGVLTELEEPTKQVIENINIELFEGDNYIYLLDMQGNKMLAEYLIKNDFTDTFVTINQMNSTITQTAGEIELSVNQKLTGYSTTEEMNAAINLSAQGITSTVSKNYATKNELTTAKSEIKQTTDSITSTVSQKVGKTEIISSINQSAEAIQINANKINIDGKAVNFKTEISETIGPFTTADSTKALNYIEGKGSLTSEEFEKYDIDDDGEVNTVDLVRIQRAVQNGGYFTYNGTYQIDPYSTTKSISIYDKSGYYSAIISLMNNFFNSLRVGILETDVNDYGTSTEIGSSIITMRQNNTSNDITMQIGDWFNNTSSSGISISNGTSTENGSIFIVAQQTNSFIDLSAGSYRTEISANQITTPSLQVLSGDVLLGSDTDKVTFTLNLKSMAHIGGNVTVDGNIYANNISSDKRIKDNIEDSDISALDLINKIKHRQFEKKNDGKHYNIGYIAQELEEIDKNFVLIREKDEKEDEQYYVNELPLLATATKAIQELSAKVTELENKIKEVTNG